MEQFRNLGGGEVDITLIGSRSFASEGGGHPRVNGIGAGAPAEIGMFEKFDRGQ